ncbi:MAG TPA: phosphoribosylaminoimidazolesuccinocarboxamide synthase [Bacteriovoracaceae bacterium]|nr:phosphoribosylaminoimidazolesuccinocarboxamide synthase [Bacteriovoracaceae bacterium]
MKLVHKGSTKDVYSSRESYVFSFSDRYSVFDWGEMPDQIAHKGASLAAFSKTVYRHLAGLGIKTHFVDEACGPEQMVIRPFEITRESPLPQRENLFVPLEVIFRLGVAKGSSLLKKSPGFRELQRFPSPMIEFTTKLERFDRPLSHQEARDLCGMNAAEWADLQSTTFTIATALKQLFGHSGITLWDGKLEFALAERVNGNREIVLVDSIGPDELRLTKDDVLLSKEIIRQHYRKAPWYQQLEVAKKEHGAAFKDHISLPEKLPAAFKQAVSSMYQVLPELLSSVPGSQQKLSGLLAELKGES